MARDEVLRLRDILHATDLIRDALRGVSRARFEQNVEKRGFVAYQISIIGEAASHLSKEFTRTHSAMPWSEIIGMRTIGIHHYFEIDYDVVWDTAKRDVPTLARYVRALVGKR